ncbi:polymeric immunoglobulin receptor-like isoform X2 [Hoplias malabaricus]|uniref:polymeric immunoglobulin receptor-like isoform X2 n=1 Tax=Hoplias malabaricus TaxID=27720 RepID=UPI00346318C7
MKTLLIFTFFLISGPVGCFDVIGYSGGIVRIYCKHQQYGQNEKYFCKKGTDECINVQREKTWVHKERVSLYNSNQDILVIFRNLSLQDTGSYRCGETGGWSRDVELKVKRDPCCSSPSAVAGFLGETLTINCSSPEEFKTNIKHFYKVNRHNFTKLNNNTWSRSDRFSISEDRRSKVVIMVIRNVREEDGGVYYCVVCKGEMIRYNSLYTAIQLQVTGSALILYKLKSQNTQDCVCINRPTGSNDAVNSDYENLPVDQNISLVPVYLNFNHCHPDPVYQVLNSPTMDINPLYLTLHPKSTNQLQPTRDH